MSNGPIEPDAGMRTFAASMRQMFIALTLEGFSEAQAMTIIGHAITAAVFGKRDE